MMIAYPEKQLGYMRGLMVLPEFRSKIDLKKCIVQHISSSILRFRKVISRWYTETRTKHNKAQYLVEMNGLSPHAIFPNKDIYTGDGKRESDMLEITYSKEAILKKRN